MRHQYEADFIQKKQDVYPFDSIIRIDSNSSALPVKEVRAVQRRKKQW